MARMGHCQNLSLDLGSHHDLMPQLFDSSGSLWQCWSHHPSGSRKAIRGQTLAQSYCVDVLRKLRGASLWDFKIRPGNVSLAGNLGPAQSFVSAGTNTSTAEEASTVVQTQPAG